MLPWFGENQFPVYLAPMARYTDVVYRQLCKEQGADVMVTEFVRADSLIYGGPEAWRSIDFTPEQRPMGVQIFGATPEAMAEGARRIEARVAPDFIDLNFGCPANCVTDKKAGSSLLRDIPMLVKIVDAVVKAVPETPVTAKIRMGWDDENIVALEVGELLESVGVQALAIHGRTKMQGYKGEADWETINNVASALKIPVVGNGSIRTCADVKHVRETSPVSGVMIGRGAMGYPWLFREIKSYLATGEIPESPSMQERWETILNYAEKLIQCPFYNPDVNNICWMHPKLKALTKEMRGGKRLRAAIEKVSTLNELKSLSLEYLEHIENSAAGENAEQVDTA